MTIEGITVTRDHVDAPVLYAASHDAQRAPERGLLAGWDDWRGTVLVRFHSFVLGDYREMAYPVAASAVIWAEEPGEVRS